MMRSGRRYGRTSNSRAGGRRRRPAEPRQWSTTYPQVTDTAAAAAAVAAGVHAYTCVCKPIPAFRVSRGMTDSAPVALRSLTVS
eukprot:COSAG02_NODE_284_length_25691_cov_14.733354_11_plen_84_part_00